MTDGLSVVRIPVVGPGWSEDAPRLNRWVKPKGEIATVATTGMKFIAYVEFPTDGVPRANHFHEFKEEFLYLAAGKIMCHFRRGNSSEPVRSIEACAGDLITVKPGWAHAYVTVEPGHGVEFSPTDYETIMRDTIRDEVI